MVETLNYEATKAPKSESYPNRREPAGENVGFLAEEIPLESTPIRRISYICWA